MKRAPEMSQVVGSTAAILDAQAAGLRHLARDLAALGDEMKAAELARLARRLIESFEKLRALLEGGDMEELSLETTRAFLEANSACFDLKALLD